MSPIDRDSLPESWSRVAIVSVSPQVDGGRWPVRRSVGERVDVVAGIIIDGHDKIAAEVRVGHEDDAEPSTVPLKIGRASCRERGPWHGAGRGGAWTNCGDKSEV